MIEQPDAMAGGCRLIGKDDIEPMRCELRREVRQLALVAGETDGRPVFQDRAQEVEAHQLRKRIDNAGLQTE